ncbi:MAG: hypothetical protein J5637_05530 [Prevotella sp.]|nr:hypothetical protein [Prevotella sp.]
MKTSLKVILLLVAVVAVVGSLLFFAKLRLDPPRAITREGTQAEQVRQLIKEVRQGLDSDTLNQRWFAAHHLIGFLDDNQLLRPGESDTLKMQLMEHYVPAFARKCELKFGWSVWEEKDMDKMRQRIKLLQQLENSKGQPVVRLRPSLNGQLDRIEGVLDKYDRACALAEGSEYKSLADSRQRIREARQYQTDTYLRKNTHLMHELDSVAVRLQRSHYHYLERSVEALANYGTNWEDFERRYDGVEREINLFADSSRAVYGRYFGVADLKSDIRGYYRRADHEFNDKSAWDYIQDIFF